LITLKLQQTSKKISQAQANKKLITVFTQFVVVGYITLKEKGTEIPFSFHKPPFVF